MTLLKIKITKFISDDEPGWVECSLIDIQNKEWIFIEKIPVVTAEHIWEDTAFPKDGNIAGEVVKKWRDKNGKQIITINTERPWGVKSVDGQSQFDVFADQVSDK